MPSCLEKRSENWHSEVVVTRLWGTWPFIVQGDFGVNLRTCLKIARKTKLPGLGAKPTKIVALIKHNWDDFELVAFNVI